MAEDNALSTYVKKSNQLAEYFRGDSVRQMFSEVLGPSAPSYITSVLIAAKSSDDLMKCTPQSIGASALRAASLKLSVDPSTGHAYLIPFKDKANLIVGYKGLKQMALRTGQYIDINNDFVWDGEEVYKDRITGRFTITGTPNKDASPIGVFAYIKMKSGFEKFLYMTIEDIHAHAKKYSAGYRSTDPRSIWKVATRDMELKTVLRIMLTKWGYLDPLDAMNLKSSDSEYAEELPEPPAMHSIAPMTVEGAASDLGFPEEKPDTIDGEFSEAEAEPEQEKEELAADDKPKRPYSPDLVKKAIIKMAEEAKASNAPALSNDKRVSLIGEMRTLFAGFDNDVDLAKTVLRFLCSTDDPSALNDCEFIALRRWMAIKASDGGDLKPSGYAVREAEAIVELMNQ